jgi:hypothetical protein
MALIALLSVLFLTACNGSSGSSNTSSSSSESTASSSSSSSSSSSGTDDTSTSDDESEKDSILSFVTTVSAGRESAEAGKSACADGHKYGEWQRQATATCGKEGSEKRVCSVCGKAEYNFTEALPHENIDQATGVCGDCNTKVYSPGLTFTLSDDETYYIVSAFDAAVEDETKTKVVIPAEWQGLPVKEIGSDLLTEKTWIEEITIPETIEKIGAGAFSQCVYHFDNATMTVYFNAVSCADLEARNWVFYPNAEYPDTKIEIVFGRKVKRVPARLFYPLSTDPSKTAVLHSVRFAEGSELEEIGEYAFYKTPLEAIELPDTLLSIGEYAFYGTNIESINLSDGVTSVGEGAFKACEKLRNVTFGRGLLTVGEDAFNGCLSLETADLSLTAIDSIGKDGFKNCTALSAVVLPATLRSIGDGAFKNCTALQNVVYGKATQTIGASAFENCALLENIVIGEQVTSIGENAFSGCLSVRDILYKATACGDFASANGVFKNVGKNTEGVTVIFAETVRSIPARLFYSGADVSALPNIETVVLQKGIEKIGANAFLGLGEQAYFIGTSSDWAEVEVASGNGALQH